MKRWCLLISVHASSIRRCQISDMTPQYSAVEPMPPFPGCKPVCVHGKASGDSCIAIELQRHKWIGSACNSIESYPEKVLRWWIPQGGVDESFVVKLTISAFAMITVLAFAMIATVQSGFRLQRFSEVDDIFETRGAAPQSWTGLIGSWKRVFWSWSAKSRKVWRSVLTIVFAGYVVPSVLLVIFIVFSPTFLDGNAFLQGPELTASMYSGGLVPVRDAMAYVGYQFGSAALYGMPSAFGWEGADLRHDTNSLLVATMAWLFSIYVSVLGNVSLLRTIVVLLGNLVRPIWFKWTRFRDHVAKERQRASSAHLAEDLAST